VFQQPKGTDCTFKVTPKLTLNVVNVYQDNRWPLLMRSV